MYNKEILNDINGNNINNNSGEEKISSPEENIKEQTKPIKKKPGRPKGSKNKTPEEKERERAEKEARRIAREKAREAKAKNSSKDIYEEMRNKYMTEEEKKELNKIKEEQKKEKTRTLTQEEKEYRDYIYRNFLIILGYDQDPTYQLEKQYFMQKIHALAQGMKRGRPLTSKEYTYGLAVIARTIRDHRSVIVSSVKNKDFHGSEQYKINYICKIIESYMNQTYKDIKNEKIQKQSYDNELRKERELQKKIQENISKDGDGPSRYEKECMEREAKKTWRKRYEDLW